MNLGNLKSKKIDDSPGPDRKYRYFDIPDSVYAGGKANQFLNPQKFKLVWKRKS